ncbi:hypothetical protein G5I_04488 [Acromyrmex echinatior]|uniref:Uncharacterized protein n=1 Tax=Acromyrmex echinatior TaxID=103372 RepID=F4WFS9_ACREC|nr:hypothetical protein G5I_04488 [Acromyrmex echinatior]
MINKRSQQRGHNGISAFGGKTRGGQRSEVPGIPDQNADSRHRQERLAADPPGFTAQKTMSAVSAVSNPDAESHYRRCHCRWTRNGRAETINEIQSASD